MSILSRHGAIPATRIVVFAFLFLSIPFLVEAEAQREQPEQDAGLDGNRLLQTINSAVASETRSLEELRNRLERLEATRKATLTELNAYKVQNSAHGNLLLFPGPNVQDLEKAFVANKNALDSIREKYEEIHEQRKTVDALRNQTRNQIEIFGRQRTEVESGPWTREQKSALLDALGRLRRIISKKDAVLNNLFELQDAMIQRLEEVRESTNLISARLETQIKSKIKQDLFGRRFLLLKAFDLQAVASEAGNAAKKLGGLLQEEFWLETISEFRKDGAVPLFTLVLFLAFGGLLTSRLRGYCLRCESLPSVTDKRWRLLCLKLMRRSLVLTGAFVALFSYDAIYFHDVRMPVFRNLCNLLSILLFARWMLDFLKYWEPRGALLFWLSLKPGVRVMVKRLRIFALVYFSIGRLVDGDSIFLFAGRLALEAWLAAWCISFWREFRQAKEQTAGGAPAPPTPVQTIQMVATHLAALGGPAIELVGYPALAEYWYVSWSKTLFVVFWAVIFFLVIREWRRSGGQAGKMAETDMFSSGHPVHLLFVQSAWVLWAISLVDGLILAWSTNKEVLQTVYGFMRRSWTIGEISLSLMGLIYAFIILFFTYMLTRIGKHVLLEKVFAKSDMEPGLKDSITTISVYLLRALGLVLALGVLGVSSTSLAVVLGALSIGIGFGLQTIFNNFISGLILLLERPIQVGDAVEIGGVRGIVKKINVRATVVQTYDNASMIIPNSEFISSQVVNLSFKDNRLRREVGVGVAYGSDIELVRTLLLEIADRTENVLKHPRPEVLFTDHGDSALYFILRYWTTVDYYFTTPTDIRFAIDRNFREHGVEIPFPQRDVHIRSTEKNDAADKKQGLKADDRT